MKDTTSGSDIFPKKRIKPYDGMSVTADVWSQAHGEHRQAEHAHNASFHGSGIVSGLEVVANDPPDQYVFVSPGIAVDAVGNTIVVSEPVAYDFGASAEGTLFLLLGHGEREISGVKKEVRYVQNEFVIAARSNMPKRPSVELARVTLSEPEKPVKNAANPAHPGIEELDLRFRAFIGPEPKQFVRVALCGLGDELPHAASGWRFLARECQRSTPYQLVIDCDVPLSSAAKDYDLVYFGGKGSFKVKSDDAMALREYLDQNKKLIIEALDEDARESCQALVKKLDRELHPLSEDADILASPFLFGAPPEGVCGDSVLLDQQVIYSAAGYALSWSGKTDGEKTSRAKIRSAHEWGVNMICYCMAG
ncbi:MAG: DUF4159 domain-containing protein [Chloroflexota bacterium]|nr:DUF4159 domain-containing protein [Chloroflexota bacterium]